VNTRAKIGMSIAIISTALALVLALAVFVQGTNPSPPNPPQQPNKCQALCNNFMSQAQGLDCCKKPGNGCDGIANAWFSTECANSNGGESIDIFACSEYAPCSAVQPPCKTEGQSCTDTKECCPVDSNGVQVGCGNDNTCKPCMLKKRPCVADDDCCLGLKCDEDTLNCT
jgi:hypothetical protein